MIKGIGTDIVNSRRMERLYLEFGEALAQKILSAEELGVFGKNKSKKGKISFLSKKFAAKEALAKAFGIGLGAIGFKNISISNEESGRPKIILSEAKKGLAENLKIDISISDDYPFALAFVVISEL